MSSSIHQRGATLTGYAMTMALMVVIGLGSMKALEDNGETFLEGTGRDIGTPRPSSEEAAASQLTHLSDAGNSLGATPPSATPTTATPTTATTSTTTTTSPTTTTAAPTTTTSTTAAPGPSDPITASNAQIDGLNDLLDDPALDPEAVNEIEKAIDKLNDAIHEFADDKTHDGIKKLKEAIEELEDGEDDAPGLDLSTEKSNLTNIGRTAASSDVDDARSTDPTNNYVADADELIAEGDALRDSGNYSDAAKKYEEAANKVKDLLP